MNRTSIITFIVVIAVCLVGAGLWWTRPKEEPVSDPVQPKEAAVEQPDVAPPPPPAAAAPEQPEPEPVEVAAVEPEAPVEEPAAEPSEPASTDGNPFGDGPITVETLTGCKEVQQVGGGELIIEYAPNGEWKMNGIVRAKWTIVSNQVKIYRDDTDEVHYIDIRGNKLVYNGKELNMTR